MRNATVPCITVALAMALVFLIAAPQVALCHPAVSFVMNAISLIEPYLTEYLSGMRNNIPAGGVEIKLWMQNDKPTMNGCGLYFEATSSTGISKSNYFPKNIIHKCSGKFSELRMTSAGSMYSDTMYIGNDQIKTIEVHADGWHDTLIKLMCIGLSEESIVGGPSAICITNEFLISCQSLTNKWNGTDLTGKDIKMSRSARGIHKIVFRDVEKFFDGFKAAELDRDNEDAARNACDHIDLVMGRADENNWTCPGLLITLTPGYYPIARPLMITEKININPSTCVDRTRNNL